MRIGLHLQSLRPGAIGGNETYVRQLVRLLPEIDPSVRLVLFCAEYNAGTFASGPNVDIQVLDARQFAMLDATRLRDQHRLDVWFCPLLVLEPAEPGTPSVVTIPDLQHETYPEFFPERILRWRREHYRRSALRADAVLTYSDFCRRQIVESFAVSASRVHATHLDASPAFSNGALSDESYLAGVKTRYRLPDDFILYPANDWPHKNHAALFDALACETPRVDPSLQLVLTGARVNGADPFAPMLRERGLEHRVRHLGYVPEEDLPGLYAHARALVFPSLFEGFGLPVVEAMRAGCPVVCSNATGLPEVAREAALYFDPQHPPELAEALTDLTPARRRDLVQAGSRRARSFDWERTARATLDVLRRAASPRPIIVDTARHEQPLISIVTPSLQQGRFLERTLRSVLEQDYPRIEHWVIDGGSTDETLDVLERYKREHPDRLHYVSEPDGGQAEAVNKGIERARGDIIGWVNSDDTYQPGSFAAVARAFRDNPRCNLVYGRAHFISDADERLWPYPTRPRFEWHGLVHECYICQPTVFWRRAVTDSGHRLDEDLDLALDYDFWIRLGRRFDFHFIDRELANSRVYHETKTLRQRDRVYEESFAVVKRHFGWVPFSWTLGRAHYRRDNADAFFNVRPVAALTHVAAIGSLIRHNWLAPRHWGRALRDLRPAVAQAPRALRRLIAPSARHRINVAENCLVAEFSVEVTGESANGSNAVDLWWSGHHLARFAADGPGTHVWRSSLPHKASPGPYALTLRSELLRLEAARPLEARAYPVVADDCWLEQQDTLRLPGGWSDVELTFMLPVDADGDIELRFQCRGRTITEWTFEGPGVYRRRLRLPSWVSRNGDATELQFTSNAALPPDPARGETRRLAVRLRELIDRSPGATAVRR